MAVEQKTIDLITLADLVPIKSLSPDHCQELANKSELVKLPQGRYLFKAGDKSEHIIYLLTGQVELKGDTGEPRVMVGGSKASKLPLEQGKIHRASALAKTEVTYIKVDPNLLDIMLTWEQSGGYEVQELANGDGGAADDDDWMSRILQAKVFHKIPPANIQSIFMKMEAMHFKAGEPVIKQGEEGDRFYILREGKCKVIRKTRQKPEGVVLAVLSVGDNFGEEALISGGKRNASVIMATNGVLMSLSKADFLELMNEPILQKLNYHEASQITGEEGGVWIDVRLPSEYQSRHLRNSINIPLPLLRNKLDKLDADRKYIVCCDTGRRSSTATYLLTQNNFNAYVLESGLQGVPNEALQG
ncbi:MAG: cyclic nucleotide-binding domain-containing protein [Gammaproteobacteria bacterium]|nr:cyclic nucleotide-binding domain-containing protein [Gammaproteobacteria bacterium]